MVTFLHREITDHLRLSDTSINHVITAQLPSGTEAAEFSLRNEPGTEINAAVLIIPGEPCFSLSHRYKSNRLPATGKVQHDDARMPLADNSHPPLPVAYLRRQICRYATSAINIAILLILLLTATTVLARIKVNCQGTGQPVYLIGGGPAFTTWNLGPVQQHLSEHFKVCRWDMRGVGDNATLVIQPEMPVLTQWLHDMAEVLPDEPVILWGHSWGALQSLLFAREYPQRVRAIVLNNPVDPALASLEHIEHKRFVHPTVESHLRLEDIDTPAEQLQRFRSKIASYFMDAKTGWDYAAQFDPGDSNNKLNVQIWQEYRKSPLQRSDLGLLSEKIKRLIYCKYDVLMPENFAQYAAILPADRHHMIDSCGHFPWVESPEAFYEILLQSMIEASG